MWMCMGHNLVWPNTELNTLWAFHCPSDPRSNYNFNTGLYCWSALFISTQSPETHGKVIAKEGKPSRTDRRTKWMYYFSIRRLWGGQTEADCGRSKLGRYYYRVQQLSWWYLRILWVSVDAVGWLCGAWRHWDRYVMVIKYQLRWTVLFIPRIANDLSDEIHYKMDQNKI